MNKPEIKTVPRHVALIMDGNGRWARKRGLPRSAGHKKGIDALRRTVELSAEFGVKVLSVYVFSTENWKRPEKEVLFLMKLFESQIDRQVQDLHNNNVRVKFLGRIHELSSVLQEKIKRSEEKTKDNEKITLNVMINYGSRQEIIDAVKEIADNVRNDTLNINDLSPEEFSKYLYTKHCPDPELLIRTSGESRISNFMLWQLSYAEIYISEVLWPDFDKEEYQKALSWYDSRERRFGGL
ncbi:MAG: isoprenyl transferase [Candidatus Margulisiibacteriota bacterium]|nr:MAG: di-trans,poly-cis-decaprenylcistransferase [Candidatus Margulisbacteria bacterium GWD2_39_127]OGI05554.1 MAG: di-trans,poly-cis-decaprenylcistransferase [Candidatus Margulisbacteria bacterium GWF2_38_17]OGI08364.1 MAG: di-trans,poly-cis-decaprenylcistransferase [Candidatus Margulisbacteria bacterium GWE2_39_32]PZM77335.1 MAG: isoprenyl transferase [Candidatus Margulisiibacteriota bacterium]HAR63155.1 isoprenyl transferase [Candidatus Margulisiibacteriota bacterium]